MPVQPLLSSARDLATEVAAMITGFVGDSSSTVATLRLRFWSDPDPKHAITGFFGVHKSTRSALCTLRSLLLSEIR